MGNKAAFKNYYYDEQFERYYLQFMAVFAGLQCRIGKNSRSGDEEKLIPVPIMNGNRDRVAGWIKGGFTQNKPLRLPIMSANITNVELSPELRKGIGQTRRQSYLGRGGVLPDDIKTVEQYMPTPYRCFADLFIWTSNHQQRYQILEQILTAFDPSIQIQSSDAIFDWTKLSRIELVGVNYEDNYPISSDVRMLISTLSFEFPVYLSAPTDYKSNFVKDIYMRIGTISSGSKTNEEIIADLDSQGIQYDKVFDGDDVALP